MALENRLRKPRTAAGFVPEACKTQAWKTLETSRHMALENCLGKLPPKASNSSRIRGRSMQNTSLKNSRNVTFGIHKKHVYHGTWPWKTACESPLKNSRNVTFGIHEKHVSHGTWPWKTASESLEQQQDSCPKHAKHKPEKLSERHLWNP